MPTCIAAIGLSKMLLMKTHTSVPWVAGVNLGDIWRPPEALQVPTEQVEQPPPGHCKSGQPQWSEEPQLARCHSSVPQPDDVPGRWYAPCQGTEPCLWQLCQVGWWGAEEGALREAAVCVCSITGHNCLRNNHTTNPQASQALKPAVITGTKPCVKMVLPVKTAGSHTIHTNTQTHTHTHTHTQVYVKTQIQRFYSNVHFLKALSHHN